MSKHTPGPWNPRGYAKDNGNIWIDCDATHKGRRLAGTLAEAYKTGCGDGCVEANARLISAAPELLAAIGALLEAPSLNEDDLHDADVEAIRLARAAVAKATGAGGQS